MMPANKTATKKSSARKSAAPPAIAVKALRDASFPIVAVGASAGGLQAFLQLLDSLPESPGLAVVFVLHTDSRDSNSLRDVLARKSRLPVEVAADATPLQINHIYIPPPGSYLLFADSH